VAVHNSESEPVVVELVAGRMCGARSLGSGSVAELVGGLAVGLEVGNSVAEQEVWSVVVEGRIPLVGE
jgi:hypothetical protein